MFFTSQEFQTVVAALNSGFLKTLQLFSSPSSAPSPWDW